MNQSNFLKSSISTSVPSGTQKVIENHLEDCLGGQLSRLSLLVHYNCKYLNAISELIRHSRVWTNRRILIKRTNSLRGLDLSCLVQGCSLFSSSFYLIAHFIKIDAHPQKRHYLMTVYFSAHQAILKSTDRIHQFTLSTDLPIDQPFDHYASSKT